MPGVGLVGTRSSFSNNINTCHFDSWPQNVLNGQVSCLHQQLCYGRYVTAGQERALFAVCYNTATRIPEFTGHILQSGGVTKAPQKIFTDANNDENKNWISDATLGKKIYNFYYFPEQRYKKCNLSIVQTPGEATNSLMSQQEWKFRWNLHDELFWSTKYLLTSLLVNLWLCECITQSLP